MSKKVDTVDVKEKASRLFNFITWACAIFVTLATLLYIYEKREPVSNYFEYYGHMTVSADFTFPDEIKSYSFGNSNEPVNMTFVNQLWCAPLGSNDPKELIYTRVNEATGYKFTNPVPPGIVDVVTDENKVSQISKIRRDAVRRQVEDGGLELSTWSMEDKIPDVSSVCYLKSLPRTTTKYFKVVKSLEFEANRFNYIYPE